jgi:transposase
MRGNDEQQNDLFSYTSLEERISQDHPLRRIRKLADAALQQLKPKFAKLYAPTGRPSIAPEKLLRALLLQVLYSIRSERALMDQMDLHLGFRWFAGLSANEPVWEASTFSKNRERLIGGDIAHQFLVAVVDQARRKHWLSDERFAVDGTLIEACASMKSYQPKDDPPGPGKGSGWRGKLLKRDTHVSKTDPEAYLYRKSQDGVSTLSYLGHVLRDGQHGLIAAACVTGATSTAEREAALEMLDRLPHRKRRIQVTADTAYDWRGFVEQLRERNATPHVAQHQKRAAAIDGRTTRHASYHANLSMRKQVEAIFGWLKQFGGQRRTRFRGRDRVGWSFQFAAAAYNLLRMVKLEQTAAPA